MSISSKIKEALLCLKAGQSPLPYPFEPSGTPANFRGRPIFDIAKCIGCGGCANNCPSREILVADNGQEKRVIKYLGLRCTYCGRCADVCPEGAITMSREFENATNDIREIEQKLEIFMGTCQRCGRCFTKPSALEEMKMKGFREDDLEKDRWVAKSSMYQSGDATARDIEIEWE